VNYPSRPLFELTIRHEVEVKAFAFGPEAERREWCPPDQTFRSLHRRSHKSDLEVAFLGLAIWASTSRSKLNGFTAPLPHPESLRSRAAPIRSLAGHPGTMGPVHGLSDRLRMVVAARAASILTTDPKSPIIPAASSPSIRATRSRTKIHTRGARIAKHTGGDSSSVASSQQLQDPARGLARLCIRDYWAGTEEMCVDAAPGC